MVWFIYVTTIWNTAWKCATSANATTSYMGVIILEPQYKCTGKCQYCLLAGVFSSSLMITLRMQNTRAHSIPGCCQLEALSQTQPLCVPLQPDPTNKQSIVHILGMMSSLFTTLDINRQADDLEGTPSPRLTPSQSPVSSASNNSRPNLSNEHH